jgi:hypothetical protein
MLLDINEENSSLSKEEEAYLKEMISRLTSVEERQVLLEEINTMLDYTVENSPVFYSGTLWYRSNVPSSFEKL